MKPSELKTVGPTVGEHLSATHDGFGTGRAAGKLALLCIRAFGPEGSETAPGGRPTKAAAVLQAQLDGQLEVLVALGCGGGLSSTWQLRDLLVNAWFDQRQELGDLPTTVEPGRPAWLAAWARRVHLVVHRG